MAPQLLLLSLLFSVVTAASTGSQCIPHGGQRGTCQIFKECYPYLAIAEATRNTPVNEQLLSGIIQSAQLCGPATGSIKTSDDVVCCPEIDEGGSDLSVLYENPSTTGIEESTQPNRFAGIAGKPIKPISISRPRPPIPAKQPVVTNATEEKCFGQYVVVPPGENSEAMKNSYPFMVALVDKSKGRQFCGGSLIDERHVLTAAHCFIGFWSTRNLAVYLGSHDLSKDEPKSVALSATQIFKHGQFNQQTLDNDIAIVRLKEPVKYSKDIHSICLTPGAKQYDDGNAKGTLAGWGKTSTSSKTSTVLRHTTFSILTNQVCKARYKGALIPGSPYPAPPVRDTNICAGSNGRDACQ
ncbi:unnamed protein product, partial [Allacma fusca]